MSMVYQFLGSRWGFRRHLNELWALFLDSTESGSQRREDESLQEDVRSAWMRMNVADFMERDLQTGMVFVVQLVQQRVF